MSSDKVERRSALKTLAGLFSLPFLPRAPIAELPAELPAGLFAPLEVLEPVLPSSTGVQSARAIGIAVCAAPDDDQSWQVEFMGDGGGRFMVHIPPEFLPIHVGDILSFCFLCGRWEAYQRGCCGDV